LFDRGVHDAGEYKINPLTLDWTPSAPRWLELASFQ
jgi:hypothetical protein